MEIRVLMRAYESIWLSDQYNMYDTSKEYRCFLILVVRLSKVETVLCTEVNE